MGGRPSFSRGLVRRQRPELLAGVEGGRQWRLGHGDESRAMEREELVRLLGGKEKAAKSFLHLAVAFSCKYALLRGWVLRGSPEVVLRDLYSQTVPLRGSGSADLACSALLRAGAPRSWEPDHIRTHP